MGYRDLRTFIGDLEARGKLYRYRDEIDKETELIPFYRVQMRGLPDQERKVFLFENVAGAAGKKYDMSVLAGCYGASETILGLALGCETYPEMLEKWCDAAARPIPPVLVKNGPVQEEVHSGNEIQQLGLDEFPVPVEEPGFSGMIRTGLPMITKDPVTGVRNVGTYNGFFRARDRIACGIAPMRAAMAYHWQAARKRGEHLPLAIVIGCSPGVMAASSAEIPYGMDELAIGGALDGHALEMVPCKTIPLEVPAHAEAVIEGFLSTEVMEPRLPFGEYPGYLNAEMNLIPVMHVTAVTHRKNAMFTPVIVGFPPSDTNVVWGFAHSGLLYQHLTRDCRLPVEEVYFPQIGGAANFCLVRVKEGAPQETVKEILKQAGMQEGGRAKYTVVVDSDINLRDPELLVWVLSFRTQPSEDIIVVEQGGTGGLDPSAAPTGSGRGKTSSTRARGAYSRVLINATRKWPYPPVALPRKEYMEKALDLWRRRGDLPPPRMAEPWHGYELGYWPPELQAYADLIARGDYLKVGEKTAKLQEKVR